MNLVKWKNHPDQILEISNKLKEKHIFKVLEHIEKIWQSDMSNKIKDIIFDNKCTEIIIKEDDSDLIMEDIKIYFNKMTDMILAGNILDNKNIYYDSERTPGNNMLIREIDVPLVKKLFIENKIRFNITESENDILGGNDRDSFMADVSNDKRPDLTSAGDIPRFETNYTIMLSKDNVKRAESYLNDANIKYNAYNDKIVFHNEEDKRQAEIICKSYGLLESRKQPEMAKIIKLVEYFEKK